MTRHSYSRPKRKPFPRELAVMITEKAVAMARKFEDQAMHELVRSAQRALDRGYTVDQIAADLGLQKKNQRRIYGN